MAYKLDLPPTSKIHPVFHISQLKLACGSAFIALDIPHFIYYPELHVKPTELVGIHKSIKLITAIDEVLIKWKGLPLSWKRHLGAQPYY